MRKICTLLLTGIMVAAISVTAHASDTDAAKAEHDAISSRVTQRVTQLLVGKQTRSAAEDVSSAEITEEINAIIREEHVNEGWQEVTDGPQTADEVKEIISTKVDPKAVQLAYMELDEAPEALKDYILSARRQIIYMFDWAADNKDGIINYGSDDNVEEKTFYIPPRFSTLFPGWYEPQLDLELPDWKDAPISETSDVKTSDETEAEVPDDSITASQGARYAESVSTTLSKPSATTITAPFYSSLVQQFSSSTFKTQATYLEKSAHYNIGYTNKNTNESFKYWGNVSKSFVAEWTVTAVNGGITVGVRASTNSTPGRATFKISVDRIFA